MDLLPDVVYTPKSIASRIYGSTNFIGLKNAETWIEENFLNFDRLNAENICDEHNRPAKSQIMLHLHNRQKTKSNVLLFAKIVSDGKGKTFLFVNDPKGDRRWIKFSSPETNIDTIEIALKTLLQHEKKNIVVVPEGKLTVICRHLSQRWRSNESKISEKTIRLALEVYNHSLLDIEFFTNKDVQLKVSKTLTHLDSLEAEAIHIMREMVAEAENPVMLYSLGKDSSVMLHLARKAFFPSKPHSHCCTSTRVGSFKQCMILETI